MTHRLVEHAMALSPDTRARRPAPRLALSVLLCASLAGAQETSRAPKVTGVGPSTASTASTASTELAPAAASTPEDDAWVAWAAIGLGGGLLALSTWKWIVFARENSKAGELCPERSGGLARCAGADEQARYLVARDDAKSARVLAAVFGGLGAASLVTGLLLLPEADSSSARPSVAISADPLSGAARASVSWAW